jgi:hypothetical protein
MVSPWFFDEVTLPSGWSSCACTSSTSARCCCCGLGGEVAMLGL